MLKSINHCTFFSFCVKMLLSLSNSMNISCVPLVKTVKNAKISLFQTLNPFFLVLGGVVTKSAFSKTNPVFLDDFFDTKLILSQHPQQVFCYFHHFVPQNFGKLKTFSNIWMFIHHHLKFGWILLKNDGEFISQSWPLKTQFSQLSHSALA